MSECAKDMFWYKRQKRDSVLIQSPSIATGVHTHGGREPVKSGEPRLPLLVLVGAPEVALRPLLLNVPLQLIPQEVARAILET